MARNLSRDDYIGGAIGLVLVVSGGLVLLILGESALVWLERGVFPERDLYWLTSDVKCAATNWQALGWEGKELCRPDRIDFTELGIGTDKLLNNVMDWNVVWLVPAFLVVAAFFANQFLD